MKLEDLIAKHKGRFVQLTDNHMYDRKDKQFLHNTHVNTKTNKIHFDVLGGLDNNHSYSTTGEKEVPIKSNNIIDARKSKSVKLDDNSYYVKNKPNAFNDNTVGHIVHKSHNIVTSKPSFKVTGSLENVTKHDRFNDKPIERTIGRMSATDHDVKPKSKDFKKLDKVIQ